MSNKFIHSFIHQKNALLINTVGIQITQPLKSRTNYYRAIDDRLLNWWPFLVQYLDHGLNNRIFGDLTNSHDLEIGLVHFWDPHYTTLKVRKLRQHAFSNIAFFHWLITYLMLSLESWCIPVVGGVLILRVNKRCSFVLGKCITNIFLPLS